MAPFGVRQGNLGFSQPGRGFDFLGYRFEGGRRYVRKKSLKTFSGSRSAMPKPCSKPVGSYGLAFRLQLLPTPPHGDAVAFGYTVTTNHGGDLHPTDKASSRTH